MKRALATVLLLFISCKWKEASGLKLEQVLILGRHHIRTPLSQELSTYTEKPWPIFTTNGGDLTPKGRKLEGYLAEYMKKWFEDNDFIKGCPDKNEVLVRPNSLIRDEKTADTFIKVAFPGCGIEYITADPDERINGFDPIFNPVFHNTSSEFEDILKKEMLVVIKDANFTETYLQMNKILDIENSKICKINGTCDLSKGPVDLDRLLVGDSVPLNIIYYAYDSIMMAYYEGFPMEQVAWGLIKTESQWKLLSKSYIALKVHYSVPSGTHDITAYIRQYMYEALNNGTKLTILVGHDSNLSPLAYELKLNHHPFPDTYEPFPTGSMLVFQKWTDEKNSSYLKVEYIYQNKDQIRSGSEFTPDNQPVNITMTLSDCNSVCDVSDLCPWDYFMSLLNS